MELPLVEKALSSKEELLNDTRHGIAQEALKIYGPLSFDAVFWSHGPEHITRGEWKDCFSQLEKVARYCVILQCPWGSGYDYDEGHVSPSIQENEFEKFGYKVMYNGVKNTRDAGILSVKYVMEGL
jgi:hypothetical protein